MEPLLEVLRRGPILGDGPMGTVLFQRCGSRYETVEAFGLHEPEVVLRLHRDYVEAGARLLGASTFSANRIRLARTDLRNRVAEVNRRGVELAREAADGRAWVLGKMGPTGQLLQPLGELSADAARDTYQEQAAALSDAGADILGVETMADPAEAALAVAAIRAVCDLPVLVSFTFDANLRTLMGVTPEAAATAALEAGADIVGSNCGVGPEEVEGSVARMRAAAPEALLLAEPNAGVPRMEGDRAVYPVGPARFARYAATVLQQDVRIVAACCGATPDHIRAMAPALGA